MSQWKARDESRRILTGVEDVASEAGRAGGRANEADTTALAPLSDGASNRALGRGSGRGSRGVSRGRGRKTRMHHPTIKSD